MERRGVHGPVAEPCQSCERNDANITCIAFWDVWFCSKACYQQYLEECLGRPTLSQFYYLVEQQKNVLDIAKDAQASGHLNPFA